MKKKSIHKMERFDDFLAEQLKNPAFKREFDKLEPEFHLIRLLIDKRLKEGLTQSELAKKIGTKQSAISRFEAGNANPTIGFLHKLADGLGAKLTITVS